MLGRMLFVGLNTNDPKIIEKLILECKVGGITLYSRNYQTYEEMIKLINMIHSLADRAGYTILIGIDQEGYRVNRLPKEILNLKSPFSFHQDFECIKKHGKIIATILSRSNINVNFAPVLDIKRFSAHHPIGDRSFGSDAKTVIQNAIPYMKEFMEQDVIPVVKHFPGHGATKINTHYFLPVIFNFKKLRKEDLLPFKEAILAGAETIMVGHFLIPKFSFFTPSSFNKKTVSFLREELHFQKLIVTDDIQMGLLKFFNKGKIIKKAINGGFNLILIKYYDQFFKDFKKLQQELEHHKLNQENVLKSNQMLDELIKKYHITNKIVTPSLDIEKINEEIRELNKQAK